MTFISFEFNLNHIFFILILISYFIRYSINKIISPTGAQTPYEKRFFYTYIFTISNFLSIIPLCITKIRTRKKKDENSKLSSCKTEKNNLNLELLYSKDSPISFKKLLIKTFIVSLSDLIAQFSEVIFYIFITINDLEINSIIVVKILFKYFLSNLILKTIYYKHHNFSVMINLICLILISMIDAYKFYNNWDINYIYFLILITFESICYALEDVIGKKALIEEFLSPYSILFYKGIYETVLLIIFSIPFFFIKIEDKNIFYIFAMKLNNFANIFFVFSSMIMNFAYNVFIWIINDRFSPNDLAMVMVLQGFLDKIYLLIFNYEKFKENLFETIYLISIYFILTISASIHNEILIINCCGLNEYTKKNINIKSEEDFESANERTLTSTTINSNEALDINERNYKMSIELSIVGSSKDN
jgi:hypothetical protein